MLLPSLALFAGYAIFQVAVPCVESARSDQDAKHSTLDRRAMDPADFSWVHNWAAIGDSFTAGIGSGNVYSTRKEDIDCSRYDHSYPVIANKYFGPSVANFDYRACTGATSSDIYDQINKLDNGLDLIMMSAGGNDLCIVSHMNSLTVGSSSAQTSVIKTCILNPIGNAAACDNTIANVQATIKNGLKSNVRQLINAAHGKMRGGGILVYTLYAKYFNTETDECVYQNWAYPFGVNPLLMTRERRTKYNDLVDQMNAAIQSVVDDLSVAWSGNLITADWDPWGPAIGGLMCEPGASPDPYGPGNEELLFFKFATYNDPGTTLGLRKREMEEMSYLDTYMNVSQADPFSLALTSDRALLRLHERDPTQPNCPGGIGFALPDRIGKVFHPNRKGHEAIASFALDAIIEVRAKQLGVADPNCGAPALTCNQVQGSHAYASPNAVSSNYEDFCDSAAKQVPANTNGWSFTKSYQQGTVDEHTYGVQLSPSTGSFDAGVCKTNLKVIINGCDGNDPMNPMDWKFGGKRVDGAYTYTLDIYRTNRPWPVPKVPRSDCQGWYKVLFSSYDIRGAGWSTYDFGQDTLLPSARGCVGGGVTGWTFVYFDAPDPDGYEWHAFFHTPIWTIARCFRNNKVQSASGGPGGDGCRGNG